MSFLIVFMCLVLLVVLITWKFNTFLVFLVVSILSGLLLKLPINHILSAVQQGIGDTLGSLISIIVLGAMLGKLVAETGAAQQIAVSLLKVFGIHNVRSALMITGFIIGIPLYYGVGFVLMVPLIFSVVYQYKLPAVYVGLPMLAALSVNHGFLPPHPSPVALVSQLHANLGLTLLYGLIVALPTIIIAGPVFSCTLKNIPSVPLQTFLPKEINTGKLPGVANSFFSSLLPVILLMLTSGLTYMFADTVSPSYKAVISFIGEPIVVMLLTLIIATITLGTGIGKTIPQVMSLFAEAVKDMGMILLIIAGAGALNRVLTDCGVCDEIAAVLKTWPLHPLVLGWLISAVIRVSIGSATIAGLTTVGIIAPLMVQTQVNPNLMVLSIGAGSLMFSHVNDAGFWMFKEYFNLSLKDTLRSWSLMETIVSVVGLIVVLLLNICI